MCAYVVGVVRSAMRLEALTLEMRESADRAFPWKIENSCELRTLPHNSHAELWTAWRALESVTRWDESTLGHVLTVLRTTVPCADTPSDLPALGPEVHAPPEPRATAANPRAFRGTKYRPPRPEQPDAVDVRPYLLTWRHTDQVLELEADELVCFGVYGTVKAELLEPLFLEFDRTFASSLGLAPHGRNSEEDYVIASVLSHEWWDDSALAVD